MELFTFLVKVLATLKVAKDGRYYAVINGKPHYVRKGVLTHVVTNTPTTTTNGVTPAVISFTKAHPLLGEVRVITNNPLPGELVSYEASVKSKMPQDDLFALDAGQWAPQLLIERLGKKGIPFRVVVAKNGCLNPLPHSGQAGVNQFIQDWTSLVNKVDFAWANAQYTFLMQTGDIRQWGLSDMGIDLIDAPKVSKRANELVRTTMLWWYTEDTVELGNICIKFADILVPRDGMSYVSKSFALKLTENISDPLQKEKMVRGIMGGRIKRLNARVLFPAEAINMAPEAGLIKGDMVIRPDKALDGYDVVVVPENIKSEIRPTQPWLSFSASEHHATYEATWDIQRLVMNPQILTHEHRARDLARFVAEVKASVEAGVIPEWLLLGGNDTHQDEGMGSQREAFRDHDSVALRWQAHGLDIRAAQNVLRMAVGSVVNRMGKHYRGGVNRGKATGYAKALPLRKSNAFVGLIVSHGSLTRIGGYRTRYDGTKAWFAPGIGIVIPDQRFAEVAALMGGADFDDSAEQNLVKIWSSDQSITEMMRKAGAIGRTEVIPSSREEAVYRSANLRSPNGVGEYSFLDFEDILDLPWQDLDLDHVEVIDLATLPLPQPEAIKLVQQQPVVSSLTHSKVSWTRADALRQILAQQYNPGIGGVANSIMAWSDVAGPSFPPSMSSPFETLVDGAQQLSDPAIFAAIQNHAVSASKDALDHLIKGGTVDRYLIPRFNGPKHQALAEQYAVDGPLTAFEVAFREAIFDLYQQIEQKSLQLRCQQPIIRWMNSLTWSDQGLQWAREFDNLWTAKLNEIEGKFNPLIKGSEGLKRVALTRTKHAQMREVIDLAIEAINGHDNPGQRVLYLWAYMVLQVPGSNRTFGGYDRLMFQQGNNGALMDILIPVLEARNWATEVPEEETPFLAVMEDPDEENIQAENFGLDQEEYDQFLQICALMEDDD